MLLKACLKQISRHLKLLSENVYFLCRRGMLELHKSDGIGSVGTVRWPIALCLLAVYLICYFSLWKGISTSGKVSFPTKSYSLERH